MKPKATLESVKTTCNMCAEPLFFDKKNEFCGKGGLIDAKIFGGYYSNYFTDTHIYRFSFCEKCLANILSKCKIDPCKGRYEIGDSDVEDYTEEFKPFEEEQKYKQWYRWHQESYKNKESDLYKHFLNDKCTNAYKCNNKAKYLVGNDGIEYSYVRTWTSCEKHKKIDEQNYSFSPYESEIQQLKRIILK